MDNIKLNIIKCISCELAKSNVFTNLNDNFKEEESIENYVFNINYPNIQKQKYLQFLNLSDIDFKVHFRVSRISFQKILDVLAIHDITFKSDNTSINIETALMICIWNLSNQESYKNIGGRFGCERGHIQRICLKIYQLILKKIDIFISWPKGPETIVNKNGFDLLKENMIPDIFGCLSCFHIPIKMPLDDSDSYLNKNGYYSIILQIIVDFQKKILDAYAGCPGSSEANAVFKNSPIGKKITDNPYTIPNSSFLIGDVSFPLKTNLITPYEENENMSTVQITFNNHLNERKKIANNAWLILKDRFRRLKNIDICCPKTASLMAMTACCIHNVCFDSGDEYILTEEDLNENISYEIISELHFNKTRKAIEKRDLIANKLTETLELN